MKRSFTIFSIVMMLITIAAKGQGWITQNVVTVNVGFELNQVSALDSNTAWGISTFSPMVAHTVNGGASWLVDTTPFYREPYCVQALSADTVWISTSGGGDSSRLWKTTDGAQTWIMNAGVGSHWDFFHFFNSNEGVAFADPLSGAWPVFVTNNRGASWTPVILPAPLAGEACMDGYQYIYGDHVWITSTSGRIFYSADKGNTWNVSTIVSAVFPDVFRVAFYSALEGVAVRSNVSSNTVGDIYRSHDGGITWNMIPHSGPVYQSFFGGLLIIPNSNVVISNGDGNVQHGSSYSSDSGATWTLIDSANKYSDLDGRDWNSLWTGQYSHTSGMGGVSKWDGAPLRINEMALDMSLSIYPNPVTKEMTIKSPEKIDEIKIMDLSGRKLKDLKVQGSEVRVDVHTLSGGVYFIRVKTGNKIITQKFVKL